MPNQLEPKAAEALEAKMSVRSWLSASPEALKLPLDLPEADTAIEEADNYIAGTFEAI
jgi:hypothetical protein